LYLLCNTVTQRVDDTAPPAGSSNRPARIRSDFSATQTRGKKNTTEREKKHPGRAETRVVSTNGSVSCGRPCSRQRAVRSVLSIQPHRPITNDGADREISPCTKGGWARSTVFCFWNVWLLLVPPVATQPEVSGGRVRRRTGGKQLERSVGCSCQQSRSVHLLRTEGRLQEMPGGTHRRCGPWTCVSPDSLRRIVSSPDWAGVSADVFIASGVRGATVYALPQLVELHSK